MLTKKQRIAIYRRIMHMAENPARQLYICSELDNYIVETRELENFYCMNQPQLLERLERYFPEMFAIALDPSYWEMSFNMNDVRATIMTLAIAMTENP